MSEPQKEGLRYNEGKNQLELIPPEWIWALGMVLTRGAAKYEERNWEKGMKWSFVFGSMMRHMLKLACGEMYDPETGCHHAAHIAWNGLAYMSYHLRGVGTNDMGKERKDLVEQLRLLERVAVGPGPELKAVMEAKAGRLSQAPPTQT